MTKIKICGLRRIEDCKYINEAKPDYAGFVFWEKSKRNVSFGTARRLRNILDPSIRTAGVFVNRDIDDMVNLAKSGIISVIQLHGSETEEIIEKLKGLCPKGTAIWKAFEVKTAEDIERANASSADMILVDSGKGSGNVFDWSILNGLNRDYILAGGLSPENVGEAIRAYHPYGVDVSSKVETDGYKDQEKIMRFCAAARGTDIR